MRQIQETNQKRMEVLDTTAGAIFDYMSKNPYQWPDIDRPFDHPEDHPADRLTLATLSFVLLGLTSYKPEVIDDLHGALNPKNSSIPKLSETGMLQDTSSLGQCLEGRLEEFKNSLGQAIESPSEARIIKATDTLSSFFGIAYGYTESKNRPGIRKQRAGEVLEWGVKYHQIEGEKPPLLDWEEEMIVKLSNLVLAEYKREEIKPQATPIIPTTSPQPRKTQVEATNQDVVIREETVNELAGVLYRVITLLSITATTVVVPILGAGLLGIFIAREIHEQKKAR